LIIAKLDRLSRNASFTLALRDSGVKFVCCDMPEANDLTIGVLAVVNQNEAQAISKRTKEALAAAKAREYCPMILARRSRAKACMAAS
jgi:DNA invertase Pin-like site-specific DNA recombinase